MTRTAPEDIIEALGLSPHPEGGFYRETYRAKERIPKEALPERFGGPRSVSTTVYFLLRAGDVSVFHRIASDEGWFFHLGEAVTLHVLDERGHTSVRLGVDIARGERPHVTIPSGAWFGARIEGEGAFALVSCTVAPGFDFADFEMAERAELLRSFPEHEAVVLALTRPTAS